ncbi:tetratricopeptide repeat protein [Haladaptatus cibarius]|uniref:tetratricopeptide repeat protein n=1 Tax=Haladaptatus cibarius TaxID=453847 RepID=UPI0006799FA8|nr:tetratricopeptide repeat protein [Haladaptatus cibarius]
MSDDSTAEELFEFLAQRRAFIKCIVENDGPTSKQTLIEETGTSQPTVDKARKELDRWNLIEEESGVITSTLFARLVWEAYHTLQQHIATIIPPDSESPLWPTEADQREVMRLVANRLEVIESVEPKPREKRDIVDCLDVSSSTVNRAIRNLESLGLVSRESSGYTITSSGQQAIDQYRFTIKTIKDILKVQTVLQTLPATSQIQPSALVDSEVEKTANAPPYHFPTGLRERIENATHTRLLLPVLASPQLLDCCLQEIAQADMALELLTTSALFDTLTTDFPGPLATMATIGRDSFTASVIEATSTTVPTFGLVLTETDTATAASIIVYSNQDTIQGVIHASNDAAINWATKQYARARNNVTDVTDDLRDLAPDGAALSSGRMSTVGDQSRVAREAEGFVQLSPDYFTQRTPSSPATAVRSGIDLVDVHAGYAIDREGKRDESRYNFTSDIIKNIRTNTNQVVIGPPGSGKSTVCKAVACQWYEQGIGPVFYRSDSTGTMFNTPAEIREQLRESVTDGHVLVVVEEAVRPEANAIFRVMKSFRGNSNITFLLDSRTKEWKGSVTSPTDAKLEAYRKEAIEEVPVPGLDKTERGRFIQQIEQITNHTFSRAISRQFRENPNKKENTDTPSDSRKQSSTAAEPSDLLVFLHRLVMHVDPLAVYESATPTTLVEDVQRTYEDLQSRGDLALNVGLVVNMLNTAGIGVFPTLVCALAGGEDESEIETVREILSSLEGRLVFTNKNNLTSEDAPYRAVHEAWSALFLNHFISTTTNHAASKRIGHCITALLRLADSETLRNRIMEAFLGDTPVIEGIAAAPREWADNTVEQLFQFGMRRPSLSPLYGQTKNTFIKLPKVCSLKTTVNCTLWRAGIARQTGKWDRAEEEYEALSTFVSEVETQDTEWAATLRGQQCQGLGIVAWYRGEFNSAKAYYVRALNHYSEDEDKRRCAQTRMNLGLVSMARGDMELAEDALTRSYDLHQELKDTQGAALSLSNLAGITVVTEGVTPAIDQYRRALDLTDEANDTQMRSNCLQGLGRALAMQGDLDAATSYCMQALELCREMGIRDIEAYSLAQLGLINRLRGNFSTAEDYHKKSLAIRQEISDQRGEAGSLASLGLLACKNGALDTAEKRCLKSINICQDIGDHVVEAKSLATLGLVARNQGTLQTAEKHLYESLSKYEDAGHRLGKATVQRRLGSVACDGEQYRSAETNYMGAVRDFYALGCRIEVKRTINGLRLMEYRESNSEKGAKRLEEAMKLYRH